MLLRTLIAVSGASLLSACTIPLWGDDPELVGTQKSARPLEVPPDLTRPNSSQQYAIPAAPKADCPPPAAVAAEGAPVAAPVARTLEERLQELQTLRQQGLITELELSEKRKRILESL